MDTIYAAFFSWLKTQGPFTILAFLVIWFNRRGEWVWKREANDRVVAAAAKSETEK